MTKHSSNRRTQSPSVAQQSQQTIYNNAGDEVKCRLCYLDAEFNRYGYPEDMLTCKECRTTVHPSCMNYSSDLARRARDSPWQCYECKTCCICNEAGDPAELLFCDACDKGYHMQCHDPKISENPTGKWACARCAEQYGDIMATSDSNQDLVMFTSIPPDSTFLDKNGNQKDASLIENMCANFDIKRLCSICTVDWTIDDVTEFITKIGFSEQAENFKEQEIDGKSLLLLKRNDVLTGLSLKLGPALKIYEHIHNIQSVAGGF